MMQPLLPHVKQSWRRRVKDSLVTLIEFQKYRYKKGDWNGYSDETKSIILTESSLEQLNLFNEEKRFLDIRLNTLNALNFIGIIKIPGLTIQILPKLFKNNNDERKDLILRNVLKMLSYSPYVPVKEIDISDLKIEDFNFFEIFIYLFAINLIQSLKINYHTDYVKRNDDLPYIKESIRINEYGNPAYLHIVPCKYHERSADTTINQTLKYTSFLMLKQVRSDESFQSLRGVLNILADVSLVPVTDDMIRTITFHRMNIRFKPFIDICRIFLRNSTLTLQASEVDTLAMLIPMEKLFESFIAGVIDQEKESLFDLPVKITTQKYIEYLARNENGKGEFALKPDIIVDINGIHNVIDTKYKIISEEDRHHGVSQQDIYQMYAYATKSNAKKILLLYPNIDEKIEKKWILEHNNKANHTDLFVRTIDLSFNLLDNTGWEEFKQELKRTLILLSNNPPSQTISGYRGDSPIISV
jgi:5-methylcytosine-specific restriction enzyme subunit McrC